MDLGLSGKVVFVAGASQGIGYGIAETFLAEGAKVMITARGEQKLAAAEQRLAAHAAHAEEGFLARFAGDMTLSTDIRAALDATEQQLGPLDIAVANVGGGEGPPGFPFSDDDWAATIQQNLTGSIVLMREASERMLARPAEQREGANLVAISSIAGVDAMGGLQAYGACKAALNHFVRNLGKHLGPKGIRVNVISPGNIMFPGGSWEQIVASSPDFWNDWIDREVALKRFGTVQEIADAVAFCASARASFMCGEDLVVDGGQVR